MRYLGIDYGLKRVGVAVAESAAGMAFPLCVLVRQSKDQFFAALLGLAEQEQAGAFVVGLPLRTDGTDSETTRQVRNMAARLKRRTPLPVYLVDETLSSAEAEERLRAAGKRGKSLAAGLDKAAAVLILETFLALPCEQRTTL